MSRNHWKRHYFWFWICFTFWKGNQGLLIGYYLISFISIIYSMEIVSVHFCFFVDSRVQLYMLAIFILPCLLVRYVTWPHQRATNLSCFVLKRLNVPEALFLNRWIQLNPGVRYDRHDFLTCEIRWTNSDEFLISIWKIWSFDSRKFHLKDPV